MKLLLRSKLCRIMATYLGQLNHRNKSLQYSSKFIISVNAQMRSLFFLVTGVAESTQSLCLFACVAKCQDRLYVLYVVQFYLYQIF